MARSRSSKSAAPRHSNELFRLLVESAREYAIFTTDLKRTVTSWNAGAERISGFTEEDAIGKSADFVFVPEDRQARQPEKEAETAAGEGRAVNERWHLRKDGSRFWGSGFMQPLRDSRGRHIGYVKVMQDRTEVKFLEERLAHKAEELEEFSQVAAHDLQSPLNKIRSFAELLSERVSKRLDAQESSFLNRIKNSAERMSNLIQDLLRFAKTVDPQGALEVVDLNDVVKGVLWDMEVVIAETRARIQVEPLPKIRAHNAQMHQLFLNLVGNSLKFRREGVRPQVLIASRRTPRQTWEITVSDNGIGFDPEDAGRLFKPFARLHSYDTYKGSGIGLARCRKIVQFLGGSIRAEGRPGKGATFVIEIPPLAD
jgi:PAS domain S-box-containing protein